jgi:L-threonylcarbamoyladenylate synthase
MRSLYCYDDAATILLDGGVGTMPTDTVYGLVARAEDIKATTRLYELKKRERKPGTVIAANIEQLVNLGVSEHDLRIAEHFWPNPISIVINLSNQLGYLHQNTGSMPFRVVASKQLGKLLEMTGPLVTSSANQPGQSVSTTIQEAKDYFQDKVDFYIDGGNLSNRPSSTIIKIVGGNVEVLRQGAFNFDDFRKIDF